MILTGTAIHNEWRKGNIDAGLYELCSKNI